MQLLSLKEASQQLGISRQWLWTLTQMNRIKTVRIGNAYCFEKEEIEAYLNSNAITNSGEMKPEITNLNNNGE